MKQACFLFSAIFILPFLSLNTPRCYFNCLVKTEENIYQKADTKSSIVGKISAGKTVSIIGKTPKGFLIIGNAKKNGTIHKVEGFLYFKEDFIITNDCEFKLRKGSLQNNNTEFWTDTIKISQLPVIAIDSLK